MTCGFVYQSLPQKNFGDNHIIIRPIIPRALWIPIVQFQIQPISSHAQVLDEIIITIQKIIQNIQDVPLAITAYTSEGLETLDVEQFDDLANFVHGLEVQEQSTNNSALFIRGITSDSTEATIEPHISIFLDGVDMGNLKSLNLEGVANIPIVQEKAAARAALRYKKRNR